MMKILIVLPLLLTLVSNVNGCGRPCSIDADCADAGLCCTGCCPGAPDCSDGNEPNICGPCPVKEVCPEPTGFGICVDLCTAVGTADSCTGGRLCCSNGCGKTCQCPAGQCVNPEGNCGAFSTCFVDPCDPDVFNRGGCSNTEQCLSNYCGPTPCTSSCRPCPDGQVINDRNQCVTPVAGDPCTGCIQPRCACGLCPNGKDSFGCCGGCTFQDDGTGNLVCGPVITSQDDCKVCGGFDMCLAYFDGCNDCTCNPDGTEACTEKACKTLLDPKCIKVKCDRNTDCDRSNGFRCRNDPICFGSNNDNELCSPNTKVCVITDGNCASDADCDTNNGFNCVGMTGNSMGKCSKYEERS